MKVLVLVLTMSCSAAGDLAVRATVGAIESIRRDAITHPAQDLLMEARIAGHRGRCHEVVRNAVTLAFADLVIYEQLHTEVGIARCLEQERIEYATILEALAIEGAARADCGLAWRFDAHVAHSDPAIHARMRADEHVRACFR